MASEVEICNLALAHLGDTATVASINPAEPTMQAELCARYYPIARDALLEMPDTAWAFATKRAVLPLLSSGWPEWDYSYALPGDCLRVLAVQPASVSDDNIVGGVSVPCEFSLESNDAGSTVIYTDQQNAVARYVARVTDTTKFSPTFVIALSWELAAMLAGPLIKGDVGSSESARCLQMAEIELAKAVRSDASNRRVRLSYVPSFIQGR